jgi:hypothetical protein
MASAFFTLIMIGLGSGSGKTCFMPTMDHMGFEKLGDPRRSLGRDQPLGSVAGLKHDEASSSVVTQGCHQLISRRLAER